MSSTPLTDEGVLESFGYQVWPIVLIFGVLSVIGLLYVLITRPQDRIRASTAMGDLAARSLKLATR